MSGSVPLLDSATLLRLERLTMTVKGRVRGSAYGRRRSKQTGASLDFADYRLYAPGDDIRQVDWKAYGRTGRPFVKLFHDEREQHVRLWLDVSASMNIGADAPGSPSKLLHAKRLAAAIGYIALSGYDRVSTGLFGNQALSVLPVLRGKPSAGRLLQFFEQAETGAEGDMERALTEPGVLPRQPGTTWIFSDFLYESGVRETLNVLQANRQDVAVIQVLSPAELEPDYVGDLRLIDVETGMAKEVAMSAKVLQAYRKALDAYTTELRAYCHERGITYALAPTRMDVLDWIGAVLRPTGALQ